MRLEQIEPANKKRRRVKPIIWVVLTALATLVIVQSYVAPYFIPPGSGKPGVPIAVGSKTPVRLEPVKAGPLELVTELREGFEMRVYVVCGSAGKYAGGKFATGFLTNDFLGLDLHLGPFSGKFGKTTGQNATSTSPIDPGECSGPGSASVTSGYNLYSLHDSKPWASITFSLEVQILQVANNTVTERAGSEYVLWRDMKLYEK